jgi:hypothetical protein
MTPRGRLTSGFAGMKKRNQGSSAFVALFSGGEWATRCRATENTHGCLDVSSSGASVGGEGLAVCQAFLKGGEIQLLSSLGH